MIDIVCLTFQGDVYEEYRMINMFVTILSLLTHSIELTVYSRKSVSLTSAQQNIALLPERYLSITVVN